MMKARKELWLLCYRNFCLSGVEKEKLLACILEATEPLAKPIGCVRMDFLCSFTIPVGSRWLLYLFTEALILNQTLFRWEIDFLAFNNGVVYE